MEALILAIVIAYAIKRAAERSHGHWQSSKAANRKASKGKPVRERARSAARHDTAYWARQARGGFPQVRHGLYMGWHAGRIAQLDGREERAKARADHAQTRERVTKAVRDHRRRQAEALERIRAAARQPEPEPAEPEKQDTPQPQPPQQPAGDSGSTPATTPTEGNAMPSSGDTTYRQQMAELEAIRGSAEQEVNSTRRKLMVSRLDVLQNLGLDSASLAEAAAIDDALQAQEKAAQQTLDAAEAAVAGLQKRHGGIQEAVDSSPVDKPAEPEFYQD